MKTAQRKQPWAMNEAKFLKDHEFDSLRTFLKEGALQGGARPTRRWIIIDLLLSTGLRCFEACDLRIEDCLVGSGESSIIVRRGKGGHAGTVILSDEFKHHLIEWIAHTGRESGPLFLSERGNKPSRSAMQTLIKRTFAEVNLNKAYSIHTCRHTFCTRLYRESKNLLFVQRQARHRNYKTTEIYAHIFDEDLKDAMNNLNNSNLLHIRRNVSSMESDSGDYAQR